MLLAKSIRNLSTLLLFLTFSIVSVANQFELKDVPSWVHPVAIPESSGISKYDVIGGYYSKLVDEQMNLVENTTFTHVAFEVLTNAGVQRVSDVSIPYDTAYMRVEFHYLNVWRNGKKIDRTGDLTFEFLRNEAGLNQSMYLGRVTAHEILEDIRKGDVLEYAYSIIGENPIFDNKPFDFLPLVNANPIDLLSIRIVHDKGTQYNTRCSNCDEVSVEEFDEDGFHVIQLRRQNLEATDFEDSMPPWLIPYPYYSFSGFTSWEDVDTWATGVFELDTSAIVNELVADIQQNHKTLQQQIDAAVNYVQDDIRYMALEDGIGSIKPFLPSKVISQRFGDCKDKSLLLSTLLKGLGVNQAYPALVNTSLVRGVSNMLPSAQVFNHCIAHFRLDDVEYWIDPTISLQGGTFKEVCIPDYGLALVVGDTSVGLVKMNVVDTVSRVEVNEEFTFADFEKPCFLTVETKYFGIVADKMRGALEYMSRKDLSDELRKRYGRLFPSIQKDQLIDIKDDEENNIFTTVETYFITDNWKSLEDANYTATQFRYEPSDLYDYIGQSECEKKKHPVYVHHPTKFSQTTILNLPEKLAVDFSKTRFDNAGFTYESIIIPIKGNEIELRYSYVTKTDEITAKEFEKACSDMNEIAGEMSLILTYSKPKINHEQFRKELRGFNSPGIGPGPRLNR
ncbi:MAG: DUF3857 domain-containing protein [Flavobacteriales bacterium]|nr:DUF3857 domain-containing protein [Flavobacteriales bacterium]